MALVTAVKTPKCYEQQYHELLYGQKYERLYEQMYEQLCEQLYEQLPILLFEKSILCCEKFDVFVDLGWTSSQLFNDYPMHVLNYEPPFVKL